ncbi:MAG: hypothetical protein ACJAXA_001518 [Candidatus Aldehydirespiratoraceae bacterium]|jgi:hypothetical protein
MAATSKSTTAATHSSKHLTADRATFHTGDRYLTDRREETEVDFPS